MKQKEKGMVYDIEQSDYANKENKKSYAKRKINQEIFSLIDDNGKEKYDEAEIRKLIEKICALKTETALFSNKTGSDNSFLINFLHKNQADYTKDFSLFLTKFLENEKFEFVNNRGVFLKFLSDFDYNNFSKNTWLRRDWNLDVDYLYSKIEEFCTDKEYTYLVYALYMSNSLHIKKRLNIIDTIYSLTGVEKFIYHTLKTELFFMTLSGDINKIREIERKINNIENKLILLNKNEKEEKNLREEFLMCLFKLWDNNILNEEIAFLDFFLTKENLPFSVNEISLEKQELFLKGKLSHKELLEILRSDMKSKKDNQINEKLIKIKHFLKEENIDINLHSINAAYSIFYKAKYKYKNKGLKYYLNDLYFEDKIAFIFDKILFPFKEDQKDPDIFMFYLHSEIPLKKEFKDLKRKDIYSELLKKIDLFYEESFIKIIGEETKGYGYKFYELKYSSEAKEFIYEIFKFEDEVIKKGIGGKLATNEELDKEVEEYYIEMNRRRNPIDIFYLFYSYINSLFLEYFINLKKIEIRKAGPETHFEYKYDYQIERLRYNEILPLKILDYYFWFEYFKDDEKLSLYLDFLKVIKSLDKLLIKIREENNIQNYEDKLEFVIKEVFSFFIKNVDSEKIIESIKKIKEKAEIMRLKTVFNTVNIIDNYI